MADPHAAVGHKRRRWMMEPERVNSRMAPTSNKPHPQTPLPKLISSGTSVWNELACSPGLGDGRTQSVLGHMVQSGNSAPPERWKMRGDSSFCRWQFVGLAHWLPSQFHRRGEGWVPPPLPHFVFQTAGWGDSNVLFQIEAATNAWRGAKAVNSPPLSYQYHLSIIINTTVYSYVPLLQSLESLSSVWFPGAHRRNQLCFGRCHGGGHSVNTETQGAGGTMPRLNFVFKWASL